MNVLHVPGIVYQLLSVSQISNKGFNVKFNDGRCHMSFDSRAPIPKTRTSRSTAVLDLVHSDILGPVNVLSLGGSRYFIVNRKCRSSGFTVAVKFANLHIKMKSQV